MKGFGVSLFIALAIVYSQSSQATETCASLFSYQPSSKVAMRVNKKISIPYDDMYAIVLPDFKLSEKAQTIGIELIKTRSLFTVHVTDIEATGKTVSPKKTLELGDELIILAKKFAAESGLRIKTKKNKVMGVDKNIIVILPEGDHPLNIEARALKEKHGTEVLYNPYGLLESGADAYFSRKMKMAISEHMMVNGTIQHDAVGKHELTHMRVKEFLRDKVYYLFHGEAYAIQGKLPGRAGVYDKFLSLDEMDAFFTSVEAQVKTLINFQKETSALETRMDKLVLMASNISYLKTHLASGHLVSIRTNEMMTTGLKTMKSDASSVSLTIENGYYKANWIITLNDSKTNEVMSQYFVSMPFLPAKENMTRAEVEQQLMDHVQSVNLASIYYRNLYKVGIDLFKKIETVPPKERIVYLKKYQKILKRKYLFDSFEDVPTQKELAESLE